MRCGQLALFALLTALAACDSRPVVPLDPPGLDADAAVPADSGSSSGPDVDASTDANADADIADAGSDID
jgi:hypothetical protein